jgi:hypothetical protein
MGLLAAKRDSRAERFSAGRAPEDCLQALSEVNLLRGPNLPPPPADIQQGSINCCAVHITVMSRLHPINFYALILFGKLQDN